MLGAVVPASGTSRTFYRCRPKTCWPAPDGALSVGAPVRKESSRLVLLRSACGLPTDRRSGEKKYYLAKLPEKTDLRTLAATIKVRWICEQAHQQLKETWSRSLRGPILAGPSPSCAHDDDRLRFPPISPAQNSKAVKKDSTGCRRGRHCPPCRGHPRTHRSPMR